MKTLLKIQKVIDKIKESDVKKLGRNDFSGYDYFTPEQIDGIVSAECKTEKLFYKFDLARNEFGISGSLKIYDLEDLKAEPIVFEMASDVPAITATNAAQQLGGSMTYTKRYLLQNAFNINDNNLDPDSTNQTKKREEIKITWLTKPQFESALNSNVKGIGATLEKYSTATFKMSKEFKTQLENKLNDLISSDGEPTNEQLHGTNN